MTTKNPNAWTTKGHTSAVRYGDSPYQSPRNSTRDIHNPKRTQRVRERRFDRWTLITWLCLAVMVMVGGWFIFSKIADWWTGFHDNMLYGTPLKMQCTFSPMSAMRAPLPA